MALSECYRVGMKKIRLLKEGNVVPDCPLLSLCIPTNGVLDWVSPVLKSIYDQDADEHKFEVVVTDNGNNIEFQQFMQKYAEKHFNLRYRKTRAQGFLNQIECFREARGVFLKFVNHRMMLKPGVIEELLHFIQENQDTKPIVYFLNGSLPLPDFSMYKNFDTFVGALSYYSSWSGGLGIWKYDFERINKNQHYNALFPHTTILFQSYENRSYCIDNRIMMMPLPENHPKGSYNLFFAFAVEYPSIICELYRSGRIEIGTFLKIKRELLSFLASLYLDYFILHRKCSYDLSGVKDSIGVYYSRGHLFWAVCHTLFFRIANKLRKLMFANSN